MYFARGPVWGSGYEEAKLALVGEAPGPDEAAVGKPFVGQAGRLFDIALKAAGIARGTVWVTNAVKCMPPRPGAPNTFRKPTKEEVEFCTRAHLYPELDKLNPNVVVALGDVALHALVRDGERRKVLKWRGTLLERK